MSLSVFGGIAAFVEERFRDGIRIFVKMEIYCFFKYGIPHRLDVGFPPSSPPIKGGSPSILKSHISPPLKAICSIAQLFGYLLVASIS